MAKKQPVILLEEIEPRIMVIRGQRVLLGPDLARLYGTSSKALNQAVKRNLGRFPNDFVFQLSKVEKGEVVTNCGYLRGLKFSRTLPYAFTEHGAIMAASVLNTPRAVEVSVYVVRAFVKLRAIVASHKELAQKLSELERKVGTHDEAIRSLVSAIRQLMTPAAQEPRKGRIGFCDYQKA